MRCRASIKLSYINITTVLNKKRQASRDRRTWSTNRTPNPGQPLSKNHTSVCAKKREKKNILVVPALCKIFNLRFFAPKELTRELGEYYMEHFFIHFACFICKARGRGIIKNIKSLWFHTNIFIFLSVFEWTDVLVNASSCFRKTMHSNDMMKLHAEVYMAMRLTNECGSFNKLVIQQQWIQSPAYTLKFNKIYFVI